MWSHSLNIIMWPVLSALPPLHTHTHTHTFFLTIPQRGHMTTYHLLSSGLIKTQSKLHKTHATIIHSHQHQGLLKKSQKQQKWEEGYPLPAHSQHLKATKRPPCTALTHSKAEQPLPEEKVIFTACIQCHTLSKTTVALGSQWRNISQTPLRSITRPGLTYPLWTSLGKAH